MCGTLACYLFAVGYYHKTKPSCWLRQNTCVKAYNKNWLQSAEATQAISAPAALCRCGATVQCHDTKYMGIAEKYSSW